MPFIRFPTHGVDGFYEDALKKSQQGRIILFAKKLANGRLNIDEKGSESYKEILSKKYENNFYPIAFTTMNDPLKISTQIQWERGGNLVDAFKVGLKEGMNAVTNSVAEIIKNANQEVNELSNGEFGWSQAEVNAMMRKYRRKVISAASAYKNYAGSDTTIDIPTLEFTFPAQDFESTHLKDAYRLLTYLLPIVEIDGGSGNEQNQKMIKESNASGVDAAVINATSWMYEKPPNNYVNPAMGFNNDYIEGTFALDVSGTVIEDLIPTGVVMTQSRARVLSRENYGIGNSFVSKAVSVLMKNNNLCMKNFYTDDEYKLMTEGCQKENNIPAVVRLYVSFDIAKKMTIYDWQKSFFTNIQVSSINDVCDRSDSPAPTSNSQVIKTSDYY